MIDTVEVWSRDGEWLQTFYVCNDKCSTRMSESLSCGDYLCEGAQLVVGKDSDVVFQTLCAYCDAKITQGAERP